MTDLKLFWKKKWKTLRDNREPHYHWSPDFYFKSQDFSQKGAFAKTSKREKATFARKPEMNFSVWTIVHVKRFNLANYWKKSDVQTT